MLAVAALMFAVWRGGRDYVWRSREWVEELQDVPNTVEDLSRIWSRNEHHRRERGRRRPLAPLASGRSVRSARDHDPEQQQLIRAVERQQWQCARCARSLDGVQTHPVRVANGEVSAICTQCVQRMQSATVRVASGASNTRPRSLWNAFFGV